MNDGENRKTYTGKNSIIVTGIFWPISKYTHIISVIGFNNLATRIKENCYQNPLKTEIIQVYLK